MEEIRRRLGRQARRKAHLRERLSGAPREGSDPLEARAVARARRLEARVERGPGDAFVAARSGPRLERRLARVGLDDELAPRVERPCRRLARRDLAAPLRAAQEAEGAAPRAVRHDRELGAREAQHVQDEERGQELDLRRGERPRAGERLARRGERHLGRTRARRRRGPHRARDPARSRASQDLRPFPRPARRRTCAHGARGAGASSPLRTPRERRPARSRASGAIAARYRTGA